MSGSAAFKIEDKKFYIKNPLRDDSFSVRSIPRSYDVKWVNTDRPYVIINDMVSRNRGALLIDRKIRTFFTNKLKASRNKIFSAAASEDFKTLKGAVQVIDFLQKNNITKGEKLVVVGGGVIQDVGAFAAACYKRGIPWAYVPTTLLSMCDSCIGGKSSINYKDAKNQLGLFSAPRQVVIMPVFLSTLTDREIESGLGEILKLCILGGKRSVSRYRSLVFLGKPISARNYKDLILGALAIKKSIIEEDEFELNYRKALNYGHTIGHAIEAVSDYRVPHGQAVVAGMIVANAISNRIGLLNEKDKAALEKPLFGLLDLSLFRHLRIKDLRDALEKDKKNIGGRINFVLLRSLGETVFRALTLNASVIRYISKIITREFLLTKRCVAREL